MLYDINYIDSNILTANMCFIESQSTNVIRDGLYALRREFER